MTLTSFFDIVLNKRNAGQRSAFCVWLFSCNDSMSLAVRKQFLRLNVICQPRSNIHLFVEVNVTAKNHNFNIPLILDKYNIMTVLRKSKFTVMQEFTSAINVECLHSSLQAKLLMRNCKHAKHAKTCFCSI